MSELREQAHLPRSFTLEGNDADNSKPFRHNRAEDELSQDPGRDGPATYVKNAGMALSTWEPVYNRRFGAFGSDGLDYWPAALCTIPSPLNDI